MTNQWTGDGILELARGYQAASVLIAAAELDVFSLLAENHWSSDEIARLAKSDPRATAALLDSLAALGLLIKEASHYSLPNGIAPLLSEQSPANLLPMIRHQGNCLRRWGQLGQVTQTGKPAEREPSIRGEAGDLAAFIGAMHNISDPVADGLIKEIDFPPFNHVLDIGGGPGTWTIAFLRAYPQCKATLFDLPEVIPMAQKNIASKGFTERVTFVAGNFYTDPLPKNVDLAWLGAIAHQNSRSQNIQLFKKIHNALNANGRLAIRDVVMDESKTSPIEGALFAINMLVATEGGNSYTLNEYQHDLTQAGFTDAALIRKDNFMNSIITAKKSCTHSII